MDVQREQSNDPSTQTKWFTEKPKRLPLEGVQVLREIFDKGITHPKKHERQVLLDKIHALGITWYTDEKLKAWFVHNRRRQVTAQEAVTATPSAEENLRLTIEIPVPKPDSEAVIAEPSSAMSTDAPPSSGTTNPHKRRGRKARLPNYPSIKLSAVSQLAILAETTKEPSAKLIETWATLLKASPPDVDQWVKDYKVRASDNAFAAPSGFSQPAQALGVGQPDDSESEDEPLMRASSLLRSQSEQKSQIMPSIWPPSQIPPGDQLLLAIHRNLSGTPDDPSFPETASQFASYFTPYGAMMERLVQDIKTGKLESMGWNFTRNILQSDSNGDASKP